MSKASLLKTTETLLERTGVFDDMRLEIELIGDVPPFAQQVKLLDGGMRSRVALELSGGACGRARVATVWIKLRAFMDGWVYGETAKAGQPVSHAYPRRAEVDLAAARLEPADIASEIDGLWLAQEARNGMPVLRRHLQPEPLVKRDEMVRVVVLANGLQISTEGRAMRQGMLGEQVPVLLERSETSFLATVAGRGEVYVQE